MTHAFATRAVHDAVVPDVTQRPASVPIYQTSTWGFETSEEYAAVLRLERPGHVYGRGYGNPTVQAFEAVMSSLEGTEAAIGYASGTAAIHAVLTRLARHGDRIVSSRELYGGTFELFDRVLPRYGIEVVLVDPHDEVAVAAALDAGPTALFYAETIANPLCTVADLSTLAALCRERDIPSVVDNTFASPYLCRPAELGFDYVVHSATKYIGGHSDVLAGVVCCTSEHRISLRETTIETGGAMQPFDAWLCVRGLETLVVRIERQCQTALELAGFLAGHARVKVVHYPGLGSHPHHALASRQLRSGLYGGTLSFEVAGKADEVAKICESLEIAMLGPSLGGAHTLVTHPASTTHRQLDAEARQEAGIADGLVRVSVGLEDATDVIADFSQALGSG
jgi:cystathionine beta-lyase/cystathionine gamma-synthase